MVFLAYPAVIFGEVLLDTNIAKGVTSPVVKTGEDIMRYLAGAAAAAFLFAPAVRAQTTASIQPPQATVINAGSSARVAAPTSSILRSGTSVPLRTVEALTTKGKKLRVGQRFNLEVAEPVMVDGQVVIPVGSPAVGEITHVRNKGMWGKSGKIEARILYVRANGVQIRLTGQVDDKGVTGTAGVVGAAVLVPVAGFFLTGTSASIPTGSHITAFVEEDLPVSFSGSSPAPMVVPVGPNPQ
ncbi:hypothetical protein [Sphingomonas sp. S2-65]|uniref:hypothetical protein n=1 Tax=Sphingomonas sp. S2-65 TaxID=2903960 RepID=UPI001F3B8629|nr:hypothetical protein [Sphingomonas sp. S2-65]UYY57034.1 hypothetical protein LZ586_10080 [Sphingomonas sp. S2-65]